MITYWQTAEKSTLEQLKSTCNRTAQLKKTKTKQKYKHVLHQTLQITFRFLLPVMKEDILLVTTARAGGISEASTAFPSNSLWAGLALWEGADKKGEYTLCSLPAGPCQRVGRARRRFAIK